MFSSEERVYKDDDTTEVIYNFKFSDLHVGKWKEVFDLTKRYKQSVQYNDHRARTVLNEPALGMVLFSAQHKKDFISINDFGELNVDMLYIVQEIFHILHQGPGMEDLARNFSSLLVVKVDKRNLNLNKQIRVIEQLRQ
ncbi:hypothetical protein Tco_0138096 [Tanacetum coccineum]